MQLLRATLPPALLGALLTYLAFHVFDSLGIVLFFVVPAGIAFLSACHACRNGPATIDRCFAASLLGTLLYVCSIVVLALDGLICVIIALPLLTPSCLIGSLLGYWFAKTQRGPLERALPLVFVLCMPLLFLLENRLRGPLPPLHEVTSRIEVDADIQSVWDQVIAFERIEDPPTGIFRLGIAYPIEARIEGTGVGAIRHCIFSTGPFIEPITRWDAPHALEFNVTSTPAPMEEMSPWGSIEPPHLHHAFISERGQFRLSEQDGKTIIEGTTWYRQSMAPEFYWHWISDAIIHRIHLRVLENIKKRAEAEKR